MHFIVLVAVFYGTMYSLPVLLTMTIETEKAKGDRWMDLQPATPVMRIYYEQRMQQQFLAMRHINVSPIRHVNGNHYQQYQKWQEIAADQVYNLLFPIALGRFPFLMINDYDEFPQPGSAFDFSVLDSLICILTVSGEFPSAASSGVMNLLDIYEPLLRNMEDAELGSFILKAKFETDGIWKPYGIYTAVAA